MSGCLLKRIWDSQLEKFVAFAGRKQFGHFFDDFAHVNFALDNSFDTIYALRLVVLVEFASRVPSITEMIFARKATTLPSRNLSP